MVVVKTSRSGCISAFTEFGPAFGGGLVIAAMAIASGGDSMGSPYEWLSFMLVILFFSYVIGLIPAVLTGVLLSRIGGGLTGSRWLLTATGAGAGVGLLFGVLVVGIVMKGEDLLPVSIFLAVMCAFSALICALFFQPAWGHDAGENMHADIDVNTDMNPSSPDPR